MVYDDAQIEVLKGLEVVRRRPAMYIGDIADGSGLRNMLSSAVTWVVDQHRERVATELHVDIDRDSWITVRDDGPGVAAAMFENAFTRMLAGGSGVRYGVGFAPISALSSRLEVETTHGGVRSAQAFERGVAVTEPHELGSNGGGTQLRFRPDAEIFGSIDLDHARVRAWLQQLAWLYPSLRVCFQGERLAWRGGICGWVAQLAGAVETMYATRQAFGGVGVDVVLAWSSSLSSSTLRSFANGDETVDHGTHVDGLWAGVADFASAANATVRTAGDIRGTLAPGLVAIVHVELVHPSFKSQLRERLTSPSACSTMRQAVAADLADALLRDMSLRRLLEARLGFTHR